MVYYHGRACLWRCRLHVPHEELQGSGLLRRLWWLLLQLQSRPQESTLGIVLIFAVFWWRADQGGPKDRARESLLLDKTIDFEGWLDGSVTDILAFSATVFLSGTRLFIDPPPLPKIEGRSRSLIKKAFILERVLGALFSVLFFIAISGTIARAS